MDPIGALSQPHGFEVKVGLVASRAPFQGDEPMQKTMFLFDCVTYHLV